MRPTDPASQARRSGPLTLTLHTETPVEADADRIWRVLTDFPAYAQWNPCIPRANGEARTGSRLEVEIHWPGLKPGPYRLTLTAVEPGRTLAWLGHMGRPGLLDGDHRFLIEPLTQGRCRLTQTETFRGWLVPLMAPWLRRNVLLGFERMNAALKRRAERAD
jgi:hypothetical protein